MSSSDKEESKEIPSKVNNKKSELAMRNLKANKEKKEE
jgi:hypothetical protein